MPGTKQITLSIGTGYISQAGKITGKFDLPLGSHPFPDDATVTEVTRAALASVVVVKPPPDPKGKKIDDLLAYATAHGWVA